VDQIPKIQTKPTIIAGETGNPQDGNGQVPSGPQDLSQPSPKVNGNFSSVNFPPNSENQVFLSVPKTKVPPLLFAVPLGIETAEGYIELVTQAAARLGVNRAMKRLFAKKALKLAIDCGECWHNAKHESRRQMVMGQSLRLLKRYRNASVAFRKAAKHRPVRVEALMALGWCQKRSGLLAEAIFSLTRALAIKPEDPRLHYNLACYLCVSGQCRAALYELAWALELDSSLKNRAILDADFDALRTVPAFFALTASRTVAK